MEITDTRYDALDNGTPVLRLKIDGVEVAIDPYQKPYLLAHGIVSIPLPAAHEDLLPPVEAPGSNEVQAFTLDCCATTNETILKLTKRLIRDVEQGSFKVGPLSS
jgi:hypothetical protein